jgi:opine dehydrogenase
MLYNARNKGPAHAWCFGIKKELQLAAFPGKDTKKVVDAINIAFPQYIPARDILETHLNNFCLVFHPAPTILNAGRIESTKGNYRMYFDGVSESVGRFMESIDEERLNVAEKLGLKRFSSQDILKMLYTQYGAKGTSLREVILNCKNLEVGKTPDSLKFTYISQDVPYGLVPMISLADRVGIKTTYSKVTVQMACYLNEIDYWTSGCNQEYMDIIQNMNPKEIVRFFQEGE